MHFADEIPLKKVPLYLGVVSIGRLYCQALQIQSTPCPRSCPSRQLWPIQSNTGQLSHTISLQSSQWVDFCLPSPASIPTSVDLRSMSQVPWYLGMVTIGRLRCRALQIESCLTSYILHPISESASHNPNQGQCLTLAW